MQADNRARKRVEGTAKPPDTSNIFAIHQGDLITTELIFYIRESNRVNVPV